MKTQYLLSNPPLTQESLQLAIDKLSTTQPTGITLIATRYFKKAARVLKDTNPLIHQIVILPQTIKHTTLWGLSDGESMVYSKGDNTNG